MISWAVMGHPARTREANVLAWALGGTLILDEDGVGENANGDRCWAAHDPAAAWHVVLQDDALPVFDIARQAPAALAAAPASVVSFYLGTSYPPATVQPAKAAMARATDQGSAWITAPRLWWGVAIAIRTDLIPGMLAAVASIGRPYDERISRWCEADGHTVAYTWPSLVDHADGPSTIPRIMPRMARRRAYRVGRPTSWATDPVSM